MNEHRSNHEKAQEAIIKPLEFEGFKRCGAPFYVARTSGPCMAEVGR